MSWGIYLNPTEREVLRKRKKDMPRIMRPNSTIYIVFNPHDAKVFDESELDAEAYEVYLDPRNIPEGREVHVYEVKAKGKIQPRTLVLDEKS